MTPHDEFLKEEPASSEYKPSSYPPSIASYPSSTSGSERPFSNYPASIGGSERPFSNYPASIGGSERPFSNYPASISGSEGRYSIAPSSISRAHFLGSITRNSSFTRDSCYSDFSPGRDSRTDSLYGQDSIKALEAGEWYNPEPEDDDELHNPDTDTHGTIWTARGVANLGCLLIMLLAIIMIFAGYPILQHFQSGTRLSPLIGDHITLEDYSQFSLIDPDTPADAHHHTSFETGETWNLVFSDEFNREGRTFREGQDPFWTAVDLHYWGTANKEWYDPDNVYTRDGHLVIELNDKKSHNLNYTGGMLQSWNRFCFTGGYIEASVSLPGDAQTAGLWPAIWTLGNLGRAGHGGTLEGLWPYTYDTCDYGTFPNQTDRAGNPKLKGTDGKPQDLSWLQGQRLSRCTCKDDTHHPGPKHDDGTWVGRSAPEIDMIEALVDVNYERSGQVSLSAQFAPFNLDYKYINNSDTVSLYDPENAFFNEYTGGNMQQSASVLAFTDPKCYTNSTGCFSRYGFEYANGDDGYISWLSSGRKTWTLRQGAFGAVDAKSADRRVGDRLVSHEPMYIIMNLGLSETFTDVNYPGINKLLPVEMHVDYVRVYQDPNNINIGCDPPDFPTAAYIDKLLPAYHNPNISTWDELETYMEEHGTPVKKPRNGYFNGGC